MTKPVRKAVIMARGLGTRMRREDRAADLSREQAQIAGRGVKALLPIGDRPFLDYVISGLADAGFEQVCLVIGPEHDDLRSRYTVQAPPTRVTVSFATQVEPRGTADAVLAARDFAGDELFLVINSDNYYPVDVLRALRLLACPALPGFDRRGLVEGGNIEPNRIARFALLRVDANSHLQGIVEKPDPDAARTLGPDALVSMNCWLFGPLVFEACAAVAPSPRGELELADAVERAIAMGERFRVLRVSAPVLDLTSRADVAEVTRLLHGIEVRL